MIFLRKSDRGSISLKKNQRKAFKTLEINTRRDLSPTIFSSFASSRANKVKNIFHENSSQRNLRKFMKFQKKLSDLMKELTNENVKNSEIYSLKKIWKFLKGVITELIDAKKLLNDIHFSAKNFLIKI